MAEKVLRSLSTVETLPVTVSLAGTFVERSGAVVNTGRGSNCQFAQFGFERDAQGKHNTLQIYMCKNKQTVKKTCFRTIRSCKQTAHSDDSVHVPKYTDTHENVLSDDRLL